MIRPIFTLPTGKLTLHAKFQKARYADEWYPVVQDLKDTLNATHNALGLAAPQIGLLLRIFVVRDGTRILTFVNPLLTGHSAEREIDREGCLSMPGHIATVRRWKEVQVETVRFGQTVKIARFRDRLARVVQHELDHLEGILISQREAEYIASRKGGKA